MAKRKFLKSTNDFVIGMIMLALGIYVLLTDDILRGPIPVVSIVHPLILPDTYVRFIGGVLTFISAILVVKSINFFGKSETKGFSFAISREVVLTVVCLVAYTALLPVIGFLVSTFLLIFSLTCIYLRGEKTGHGKPPLTRKEIIKNLIIVFVYTVLLVSFVYIIFTRVLYVDLPR